MKASQLVDEAVQLINGSDISSLANLHNQQSWTGSLAFVQVLDVRAQSAALLLAERWPAIGISSIDVIHLYNQVVEQFDESELQEMSFHLQVNYEDLADSGRRNKARALITYLERRGRLDDIVAYCKRSRPHHVWGDPSSQRPAEPFVNKLDIALILDLTKPALHGVANFLDNKQIDANIVLITNKIPYPGPANIELSVNRNDWEELARNFQATMRLLEMVSSGAKIHFFLSTLGALAFALGSYWGTVNEMPVYHYQDGTYHLVLETSKRLKV